MYGQVCRKITNQINYPIFDLDISNYISENSPHKDKCRYNLIGVNLHHELGSFANMNLGHYVSIVKNRYNNNWYLFNDDSQPIKATNKNQIINQKTYLLFLLSN